MPWHQPVISQLDPGLIIISANQVDPQRKLHTLTQEFIFAHKTFYHGSPSVSTVYSSPGTPS